MNNPSLGCLVAASRTRKSLTILSEVFTVAHSDGHHRGSQSPLCTLVAIVTFQTIDPFTILSDIPHIIQPPSCHSLHVVDCYTVGHYNTMVFSTHELCTADKRNLLFFSVLFL